MSTPRVPPVPVKGGELDKTAQSEHRKVEKIEKISKVSETDNESRSRQKFRALVDAEEEVPSGLPTPFTLFSSSRAAPVDAVEGSGPPAAGASYTAPQDPAFTSAAESAVPSPDYSPSPSDYLGGTVLDEDGGPQSYSLSGQFWQNVDDPVDSSSQAPMQPQMEETPRSASRMFLSKEETDRKTRRTAGAEESEDALDGKTGAPPKKKRKGPELERTALPKESRDASPFGPPGKPPAAPKEGSPVPNAKKGTSLPEEKKEELEFSHPGFSVPKKGEGKEESPAPSREMAKKRMRPEGVIAPLGEEGIKYIGPLTAKELEEQRTLSPEERVGHQLSRTLRKEEEQGPDASFYRSGEKQRLEKKETAYEALHKEEEKGGGGKGKQKFDREGAESLVVESPTLTPLPEASIPMANAAAATAKPYLGPEALAIYSYMIGTITFMVSPRGDSRTEFVLNAPSFANSKFYGSTISIERFSTAPYQLNIRLAGSNEAVNAFNQNIPNLLAAFQSGRFAYTINRIEAVYEKPLFHRKESVGEKGERGRGFGGSMDNRK